MSVRIKIILILILVLLLVGIWSYFMEDPVTIKNGLVIGGVHLDIEVVKSEVDKQKGLSGRPFLPEDHGMFFVYNKPSTIGVWMPGMNFSIDVVWLDKDFKIVDVLSNLSPETHPKVFTPARPAMYMLEVNAGFVNKHNINTGQSVEISQELRNELHNM